MKAIVTSFAVGLALAVSPLALAAQADDDLSYVLVSHAPDSDSWWNTVKNGIALAGDQMGVTVEYRNPPTGDIADKRPSRQRRAARRAGTWRACL